MKAFSDFRLTVFALLMSSLCAAQTTYTVTSTARTGTGSITEAVDLANANPGADIIEFTPGLQVKASFPVFTGTSDTYMLNITESVTINGNGGAGRLVKSVDLDGMGVQIAIDISGLASATYLFIVSNNNGQIAKSIIIE